MMRTPPVSAGQMTAGATTTRSVTTGEPSCFPARLASCVLGGLSSTGRILFGMLALMACVVLAGAPAAANGTLKVGVQLEPPNLDPTSGAAAAIDEVVYANVFEGLTRIDRDGSVVPGLASDWTVTEEGSVYTFTLRENVKFHDGTDFDAEDVIFSLNRIIEPSSTNAQKALFKPIQSVEKLGSHKVRVTLSKPVGAFLTYLGWGDAVMVAQETADQNGVSPVGTGPFRFERWRRGYSINLVRNETYWGTPAKLERVVFQFIPDPTAAFAAMVAGDVDGFPNYPARENLPHFEKSDRFQLLVGASEAEMILALNNKSGPLADVRVRRALSHAVNRQDVIDGSLFGYGLPIGSHFPPWDPAYEDLTGLYPYDPDRARTLLAEAGYPDGFQLRLKLPPPSYARRAGEIVAAQLADVGIRVRVENLEWAQWLDQVFKNRNYDLTIVAHTEPMDIDIYARDDYYFQYDNPEVRRLIAELNGTFDAARRTEILKRVQRLIAQDAANVFIAGAEKTAVWRTEVSGVWANAPVQANDLTDAAISDAEPMPSPGGFDAFGAVLLMIILACTVYGASILARSGPAYLFNRLITLFLTLVGASLVVFVLLEVVPGDPAEFMMGIKAEPEAVQALREQLGLDRPAWLRYLDWLGGLLTGNLGVSYTYQVPVAELIWDRVFVSLPLAIMALTLSAAIAIPAGVLAAANRSKTTDILVMGAAQTGIAIPNFWLAMLLVLMFSTTFRLVTAGGFPGWDEGTLTALQSFILPAVALAVPQAAILARVMRSALLETLNEDYIRTARAKGLSEGGVLRRHALQNAMIPVLTILGLQFAFLLAGGVIIENVFYLPGLGRLVFQAITQRDLIVVQSVVMILVFAVVVMAFLVDLAYGVVDPRLRHGRGQTVREVRA